MISDSTNPQDYIYDSGPLYHEFQFDSWIREPWNAFSSLFFLVPVIFWLWRLRGQYRRYPMIIIFLPFLFLNGIGSSLYHAFRSSDLALMLDWMPAFIMNLLLSLNEIQGTTLIVVTHDPEIAEQTQRVVTIRDGVVENGQ